MIERSLGVSSEKSSNTITVRFSTSEDESKADFGQYDETTGRYPAYWISADTEICMSHNMNEPIIGEVVKTEEVSAQAEFIGQFEDTGAPYKFYALSREDRNCITRHAYISARLWKRPLNS